MAKQRESGEERQHEDPNAGMGDGPADADMSVDAADAASVAETSADAQASEAESGPDAETPGEQEEIATLNDRFLRLAAEFDNFRKRTVRERAEWRERAQADFARQLLETLDDLGRVAALEAENATVHDVIEGIHMVERKLLQELERHGFERVGKAGEPFDPNHHEAVATQEATDDVPAGTVGTLLQPGYRLGNVLLRPARVIVTVDAEEPST